MEKIFICGTSGIGKTTLAKHIAETRNIPFIEGSSTILWKKYNVTSHKELLEMGIKQPSKGLDFQTELLDIRANLIQNVPQFVTDRSIIDNLVYFLFQNAPYLKDNDVEDYIKSCNASLAKLGKKTIANDVKWIYLSRNFYKGDEMPIIPIDGKRIENNYYQDMMDVLFEHVINRELLEIQLFHNLNFLYMRDYDFKRRCNKVANFLYRRNDHKKIRVW